MDPFFSSPGGAMRTGLDRAGEWLKQAINPNAADPAYVPTFKKHKTRREFAHVQKIALEPFKLTSQMMCLLRHKDSLVN